jgi:hypothetical protein
MDQPPQKRPEVGQEGRDLAQFLDAQKLTMLANFRKQIESLQGTGNPKRIATLEKMIKDLEEEV